MDKSVRNRWIRAGICASLIVIMFFDVAVGINRGQFDLEGYVLDFDGNPLHGATIFLKETAQGSVAGPDGHFVISGISDGEWNLIVRYVGFQTKTVPVVIDNGTADMIRIVLQPETYSTDELIITASLFERLSRYQSAKSYSSADIQLRNTSSMGTLLDGEAGVAMRSLGPAPARPVIRGMDGERIQILQNGMKMGDISATAHDHAVILDPQSIERLDIVRGPASLIYGSSAMGGIVNAHTADIPSNWTSGSGGYIGGEGQTGTTSLSGSGRWTYGTGSRALTLRSSLRNTGNMQTPIGEIQGTDLQAAHLASGYAYRSDGWYAGASAQYSDQQYGIPEAPFDPDEEVVLKMQRGALQGIVHRRLNHVFWDGLEIRTVLNYYSHEELEREKDEDGRGTEDLELSVDQSYAQTDLLFQHGSRGVIDNGTVGFSLEHFDIAVGGEEALTPDAEGVTLAGYLVEEIQMPRKWLLQSGIRLEWNRTVSRANKDFPDAEETRSRRIWAGAVGVNGPLTENIRLGFQGSRSHRIPSVEELFSDAAHIGAGAYEIGDPTLKNEIGYGVDLFMDYHFDTWQAHLALYTNRISNYITMVPTGATDPGRGLPVMEYHGAEAVLYGGELTAQQQFTEKWSIATQADYVYGDELGDESRQPLPFMPPFRVGGSISYDNGTGWARTGLRHALAQRRTASAEMSTDGYTLTQIAGGVRLGNQKLHHVTLTIENLFDVTWRDHLSRIEQRDIPMIGRNYRLSYRLYY